ncbi:hypothetical protein EXIGLDRAFT_724162 [Exidia glandulosa HHB12029]|uniref:Uncharacterized protein n=1 Tax=Exidia glandulosa HHB12029 TaxID=1314781 RepID=A0A165ZZ41_EXIGL|nr:hypothetical protein EXIGLDRAFT_724162 [Exidia glandulosa HHB12029]
MAHSLSAVSTMSTSPPPQSAQKDSASPSADDPASTPSSFRHSAESAHTTRTPISYPIPFPALTHSSIQSAHCRACRCRSAPPRRPSCLGPRRPFFPLRLLVLRGS